MEYNRFNKYKIMIHSDKLAQIASGEMVSPVIWHIYPTNKCNNNCFYCIMKDERSDNAQLSDEAMLKIPSDAHVWGIKTVIFEGGGEPLLHPMTVSTASLCRKYNIRTALNTNGHMLDESCDEAFDYIRVSVDAATPETYEEMHGVSRFMFDKVERNIAKIKRAELGLAYLVSPRNIQDVKKFCEWAQQFNYTFIHFRPMYYLPDDEKIKGLMNEVPLMLADEMAKYKNIYVQQDKFKGSWYKREYTKCRSTPMVAVLTADGRFAVCQDVFRKFGNYERDGFHGSWKSEEHRKVLEDIDITKCPRCVQNGYNEIIENIFINDNIRRDIL